MKTLIVPDVHEDISKLEKLLKHAGPVDKTVFLGDWFDSFQRTTHTTLDTLQWLIDNTNNTNYEFLWGNHDLPYAYPSINWLKCSGYSWQSQSLIDQHNKIWLRFKLYHDVEGWLLSHAGFHDRLLRPFMAEHKIEIPLLGVAVLAEFAETQLAAGNYHPLFAAGRCRGGHEPVGGCTWLDWNHEFAEVEGLKQIVGHTYSPYNPKRLGDNHMIDTGLHHYIIIEDGKARLWEVK